jgi:hypothetical protein
MRVVNGMIADAEAARTAAEEDLNRLTSRSLDFLRDILSDAQGVNFHRFQIVAWTVVLAFVFGKQVYDNLAMPDFDPTLLALQGLSAGTYLGLKIPEPTTPQR